jgi:hypothetical protein
MNPDDIKIEDFNKAFEYEKLSRDIDSISDLDELRKLSKCYIKLYLRQQEVVSQLALP